MVWLRKCRNLLRCIYNVESNLLLQWLHDEDAITGFNTLRTIPLFEALGRQKERNFMVFFLALDWRGFVFYGLDMDCVARCPWRDRGLVSNIRLVMFLRFFFIQILKTERRVVHGRYEYGTGVPPRIKCPSGRSPFLLSGCIYRHTIFGTGLIPFCASPYA